MFKEKVPAVTIVLCSLWLRNAGKILIVQNYKATYFVFIVIKVLTTHYGCHPKVFFFFFFFFVCLPDYFCKAESPNQSIEKSNLNDPHGASEFFQMVKATLKDTFEEIVKDCPEFLTTTLSKAATSLTQYKNF